jgi:hypothetical protein
MLEIRVIADTGRISWDGTEKAEDFGSGDSIIALAVFQSVVDMKRNWLGNVYMQSRWPALGSAEVDDKLSVRKYAESFPLETMKMTSRGLCQNSSNG